jgi:hypothetical protein
MQIQKRTKNGTSYQQALVESIDGMGSVMNEGDLKVGVLG